MTIDGLRHDLAARASWSATARSSGSSSARGSRAAAETHRTKDWIRGEVIADCTGG
jgi:hypothetical protein